MLSLNKLHSRSNVATHRGGPHQSRILVSVHIVSLRGVSDKSIIHHQQLFAQSRCFPEAWSIDTYHHPCME
jgi:hypothetical protein